MKKFFKVVPIEDLRSFVEDYESMSHSARFTYSVKSLDEVTVLITIFTKDE